MSQVAVAVKENLLLVRDLPSDEELERARTVWTVSAFMKQWNREHPSYWLLFQDDGTQVRVER